MNTEHPKLAAARAAVLIAVRGLADPAAQPQCSWFDVMDALAEFQCIAQLVGRVGFTNAWLDRNGHMSYGGVHDILIAKREADAALEALA